MSPTVEKAMMDLRAAMFQEVYIGSEAKKEEKKAEEMIGIIYRKILEDPSWLPESSLEKLKEGSDPIEVLICDYIASMSDNFALHIFKEMYVPSGWSIL